MKQKNYDVQQMYKEYMQGVGSDPTAIEDILSGERQSANTGARIKHSTGKAATIAATAAVIAICAGIGFSNMNTNDDSSIKPAAATTTTAVTPAVQQQDLKAKASVAMSVDPIAVSERAFGIEIKLTAKNEAGKKVLKENAEKVSSSLRVEKDGMIVTAGSFFGADKLSGDSLTLRLFGDIFNKRIDTVPITIKLDSETPTAVIDALGGNNSATVFFKKTVNDKLFVSESGEHFWLSDYFATTDHNPTAPKLPFVILKLKDGTEVSTKDIGLTEGGNCGNGKINKQFTYVFDGKFQKGIDNVVSISYDGVEFTPQGDAKISIEKTIVNSSERAFTIEMLIKADNDAGRELLKKNASSIKFTINESVGGMTVRSSQSSAKFEKDRLSVYITGSIYGKHIEKVAVEMKPDPSIPSEVLQALGTSGNVPTIKTELPKTLTDKVFVSATGEHFWLSKLFATTDHNRSSKKASPAVFKLKDGDEVSESDYNTSRAGNTDQKQETIFFDGKLPHEPSDVASIIYDGVEFKAQ